jgi:uncharacterized membrane protein YfcA
VDVTRIDLGRVLFGLVVLFVGAYFLFRNTFGFDLPELDGEAIWPILVIALGIGILTRPNRHGMEPPKA